ncbi:MAG TPA: helix-turn-helix domain-containing protein, partial [Pseudomonadales bacterium]|nr:helix-turn-helix domain-containing protein [Pseudomonadales bacterium]
GIVVIREQILARTQGPMRQGIELAVGVLYRTVREFLGPGWSPLAVCFMHEPPRDLAPYRRAFGTGVQFNSVLNGLTCRASELDRAMPMADPQSLRTIRQYLESAARRRPTQSERTAQLILGLLPSGRCSAELVARYIGIDRRTLHRRLAREGTSFSALVDALRREAAQRHLGNPQQSVADLAVMLGFSGSSAFSRWFCASFGCAPRRWRRQATQAKT